jgi:hypothetical protein
MSISIGRAGSPVRAACSLSWRRASCMASLMRRAISSSRLAGRGRRADREKAAREAGFADFHG